MAKGGRRKTRKAKGKPLSALSPKYRQRIERALAQGKTRQQARGHRPGEARERREREREEIGVAGSDRDAIRAFLRRFNPFGFKDIPSEEDLTDQVRENGYSWFQNYRMVWDQARRKYLAELKAGTHVSRGMGYLEFLASEAEAPEVQWLYYH